MRCPFSKGFTLVELLITLLVMTVLLGLVGRALRLYIDMLQREQIVYPVQAVHFTRLAGSLESMYYYCIEQQEFGFERGEFKLFFRGKPRELTYITAAPLTGEGPAVHKLFREKDILYLAESPVYSPQADFADPGIGKNPERFILAGAVREVRFRYELRDRESDQREIRETLDGHIPVIVGLELVFTNRKTTEYEFYIQSDFQRKTDLTYGTKYPQF